MIPLEEAQNFVLGEVQPLNAEALKIVDSRGRVTVESITSSESVPPFDNTAVDGFAVLASDTHGATEESPVYLAVLESIAAGSAPTAQIESGKCSKIMTGAPMPTGADAVVMVEWTAQGENQKIVHITREVSQGDHVRRAGEDLLPNDLVIPKGKLLNPAHLGLLASLGIYEIKTVQKPKVAIFSTGDELVEGSQELKPGQIRDSNRFSLLALLEKDGFEAIDLGLIADNEETIEIKFMTAREEDILSSRALLKKGIAIERFIQSVIVDHKIKAKDLLVGDRNAILIAARTSGYASI